MEIINFRLEYFQKVVMIIKGLFRKYERWNPVHPTSGAFWGMGLGIGCGVGWGPGFGPEVIGYVGAGCGAGFSVGITFAGFGIGLPANFLFQVPYKVINMARSGALEVALLNAKSFAMDGWNNIGPRISGLQREATGRFSNFKQKHFLEKGVDSCDAKSIMSVHIKSIHEGLGRFHVPFFGPHKGSEE
ncbi:hypothetical protein ACOSP7_003244 [Xanthoceras sorbifolium]